ncbi:hypothetical protein [Prosthecodimorpha staleyi]|uniref:Tat pathway signal sequence domain protein n=1 Tax=Prosthecodimorpha staleyi TaxID=2840188 RepID=A0A947GDN9_9HYPH|nr:hypothetical protein [Prosthecodimorpha staleyi]MBT9292773.1 hypothetical protein [Prosthecodimorpha staleyi]
MRYRRAIRGGLAACATGIAAISAAFSPVQAGERDGLYVMTRVWGSSVELAVWYFAGDRFVREPKTAIRDFDFAGADPKWSGTVLVEGSRWTLRFGDGRVQAADFRAAQPAGQCFNWNAGLFCRVKTFQPGQMLAGSFTGGLGNTNVGSTRTYRFAPDGTYQIDTSSSLSSSGVLSGATVGISRGQSGRYSLGENTITLTSSDGTVTVMTAFPYETTADPTRPDRVYIGGFMMKRI